MPVGRITYGPLEPMTFAEFLLAADDERMLKAVWGRFAPMGSS